jgi:uncharacterized protein YxjI
MAAVQLAPVPAPLAVLPPFIAQYPTTLVMKEQIFSLSDDAFTVKTLDGRDVLKITADTFSLSARKRVHDPAGNHLFTLRVSRTPTVSSKLESQPENCTR